MTLLIGGAVIIVMVLFLAAKITGNIAAPKIQKERTKRLEIRVNARQERRTRREERLKRLRERRGSTFRRESRKTFPRPKLKRYNSR